ncbi:hypothetical protein C8250_015325 [Streptomyces sp. So13.3]|uniref:hypothetical protein n=1 Tax=unclassified Streptomyces TaxID=2593676 RepID=UPI001106D321|nr:MULTISPECIES: hypothetical protein [unclassified Streptomyces]NEA72600.1 hypothetical protein [Streptomyces sp. SID13588]QNA73106.1 hypothetical protein C8250_015325 [Streptomyces sp. So13.3]
MPASDHDLLPDIAIGHHPDFGIVASNPKQLAASAWMLNGFDFHPVPNEPALYALADQQRDGPGRATRAVAILRKAGYQVEADAAYDPEPSADAPPARDRTQRAEPDVAFAEHPQLGIVAATADSTTRGGPLLEAHGWQHDQRLDIYTLPRETDRGAALGAVARATAAMNRADLRVAVHTRLAQDIAAHRPPAAPARQDRAQSSTGRRFPIMNAAALAASPARAGLPGKAPVPTPTASTPAAGAPDPRIAFSRNR